MAAGREDPLGRTSDELERDAKRRVENEASPDITKTLPDPTKPSQPPLKTQSVLDTDTINEEAVGTEESEAFLRVALFIILFGCGILMILAIGAIIFYALDWAASIFDFDLSEYTQWIILFLTFINIIMSCCGCYGTYKFSAVQQETEEVLQEVKAELNKINKGLGEDNKQLSEALRILEVEVTHFFGENAELQATINSLNGTKFEMKDIRTGKTIPHLNKNLDVSIKIVRKEEAKLFLSFKEIWNLYKILEGQRIICNISNITAQYYTYSYLDKDKNPGLNKKQYNMLVKSAIVPNDDKKFFPPFDSEVWRIRERIPKNKNGAILIDEFERIVVMIYKKILNYNLKIQLTQIKDSSQDFVRKLLTEEQKKKKAKKTWISGLWS